MELHCRIINSYEIDFSENKRQSLQNMLGLYKHDNQSTKIAIYPKLSVVQLRGLLGRRRTGYYNMNICDLFDSISKSMLCRLNLLLYCKNRCIFLLHF